MGGSVRRDKVVGRKGGRRERQGGGGGDKGEEGERRRKRREEEKSGRWKAGSIWYVVMYCQSIYILHLLTTLEGR